MFNFFNENSSVSPKQSGLKLGDSFINHLISINHEIYESLDAGLEVRNVFLDISKAFDKFRMKELFSNYLKWNIRKCIETFD